MEWKEESDEGVDPHPFANILLIGPPKQGKTTGACSAPGRVGVLNFGEPNATELAHELYGKRIREVKLQAQTIKSLLSDVMVSTYDANPEIDTWVLDPIGGLHRSLLKEIAPGNSRPGWDAYGDVSILIEDFCRFMCEAPCNFVMVAHDQTIDKAEKAHPATGTSNPALGHKVMQMVDVIAYCGLIRADDGSLKPVAQIVPTEGRPVGVRGRFNRLLTPDVLQSGVVPLDLEHWFTVAEKHGVPAVETIEGSSV
jgi:hypothetical protein